MRKGKIKVEQIEGYKVVDDYGEIYSRAELFELLEMYFPNTCTGTDKLVHGEFNGFKYCLFCKNISYLGNPHPAFKKRIQIPDSFKKIYEDNARQGIATLLIGVYKYRETILFCDFDTTLYVKNKMHNSSAHIYTIDLLNGLQNGCFRKIDYRNNIITVFNSENVERFLAGKFAGSFGSGVEAFDILDDFFASVQKNWYGIDCYNEMIDADFNNKFQPEWPGFYLEYRIDKYLKDNKKTDIIKYCQNKKKGDIDLDLYFCKLGCYGDLKAHSTSSSAIQGNDYSTVMNLLEYNRIYYVVCVHDTEKDKDHGYVVTEYWNMVQNKTKLHSYGEKMKNRVMLKQYYILELNKYNKKYLKVFKQGKNSNGSEREPKIMVPKECICNFLVHSMTF